MKRQSKYMLAGLAGVLALAGVAAASVYVAQNNQAPQQARATNNGPQYARIAPAAAQPQPAQVECDDNNIVGTIGGGIAGGVIGAQFGSGSGKTVATTAGALGGAALGNKYIPTRGATCN